MSHNYPIFSKWMENQGFVREHKFHHERRWRLDYAHLGLLLCIEVEGGIWSKGRHTRPVGFLNDIEKYNTATLAGWSVLRCTPQMIGDGTAYQLVEKAIKVVLLHGIRLKT